MIKFEVKKIFMAPLTSACLILLVLVMGLMTFWRFHENYFTNPLVANSERYYGKAAVKAEQEFFAQYQGVLTDEKIDELRNLVEPAVLNSPGYLSPTLLAITDIFGSENPEVALFGNTEAQAFSLKEVKNLGGDRHHLIFGYNDSWRTFFYLLSFLATFLIIFTLVVGARIFASEYGYKMPVLNQTTLKGRNSLHHAKILSYLFVVSGVTVISFLLVFGFYFGLYGLTGWNGSVQLFTAFRLVPFTCNNLLFAFILGLIVLIEVLFVACVSVLLSSFFKNALPALVLSSGLFLLPAYFFYSKLPILSDLAGLFPINNLYPSRFFETVQNPTGIFPHYLQQLDVFIGLFVVVAFSTWFGTQKVYQKKSLL